MGNGFNNPGTWNLTKAVAVLEDGRKNGSISVRCTRATTVEKMSQELPFLFLLYQKGKKKKKKIEK